MVTRMWEVRFLDEAVAERADLPATERAGTDNAIRKLEALGPDLPFPHSSAVKGWDDLRELRPKAGKSPWRPLYRQIGEPFVIAAIAPEAKKDQRGYDRACADAIERLAKLEDDSEDDADNEADGSPRAGSD